MIFQPTTPASIAAWPLSPPSIGWGNRYVGSEIHPTRELCNSPDGTFCLKHSVSPTMPNRVSKANQTKADYFITPEKDGVARSLIHRMIKSMLFEGWQKYFICIKAFTTLALILSSMRTCKSSGLTLQKKEIGFCSMVRFGSDKAYLHTGKLFKCSEVTRTQMHCDTGPSSARQKNLYV